MVAGGHAWLPGGVHGCQGACMVGGGARVVAGGACIGHDEIWSMSGQYTSYWNAFLLLIKMCLLQLVLVISGARGNRTRYKREPV